MTITVLSNVSADCAQAVRDAVADRAIVLHPGGIEATVELLQSIRADLVVMEVQQFTQTAVRSVANLREHAPDAVLLCIAPDEVIEDFRYEQVTGPDRWVRLSAPAHERDEIVDAALETAEMRAEMAAIERDTTEPPIIEEGQSRGASDIDAFRRLMGGVAGRFDLDRLLEAYVDAVSHFVKCASYCLLWEDGERHLTVREQRGLRSEIARDARLSRADALPSWYRRNRRVVTSAELASWQDRQLAGRIRREMELFGAQLAVPLMVRGRLAGILMLGEKVLGECYLSQEIEVLFTVSSHVSLAAEGIELHQELGRAKVYADCIVESMAGGLITLGPDGRIQVCNPRATQVLGLDRSAVEGSDLRALPSPLGDMLYAALADPAGGGTREEVAIRGGETMLRVSTSALVDEDGEVMGSVLMLSDITAEKELDAERGRRERLEVLRKIVGRIAHEVKNPLTAVKTYAELISGRPSEDDRLAKFWSETVLPEIDHLDDMLRNLLRMVEQPEPHVESASLEDLIKQAVEAVPLAPEIRQQAFNVEIDRNLPWVMVDPQPTRDALAHLLRYLAGSKPYIVHVEAHLERDEDPGQIVVNMKRHHRTNGQFDPQRIFDPLHVLQDPEADLGPVISQRIISNQRGDVSAALEDGLMTMRITLPRSTFSGEPDRGVS